MTSRARHEHQIKMLDTTFGLEFERALIRVSGTYRNPLEFYTDEQIADIRAEMIEREWSRHKLNRENRKRRAA
jgi:hypothetical protein